MLVPRYWAEARVQQQKPRQITVRRFGWSNISKAEAEAMAQARAEEALQQIAAGRKGLPRREPKVPYNGADGVPIREEIIDQRGDTILTRNRYGALCLNSPRIAFIDIDVSEGLPVGVLAGWGFLVSLASSHFGDLHWMTSFAIAIAAVVAAHHLWRLATRYFNLPKREAARLIRRFFGRHPELSGTLYETPHGYRVLLHQSPIDPESAEIKRWFKELQADPDYVSMCLKQKGFRARVSPKPWRIGFHSLQNVVAAVWPLNDERMQKRARWVQEYQEKSAPYAACRWIADFGTALPSSEAALVQQWHDELSRALSGLPIA